MNKRSKNILKHLSHSILLKETGSPVLLRLVLSFFLILMLFFVIWSSFIQLNQVVIAGGSILTKDDVVLIQHAQGGVINQVSVEDGEIVNVNDTLITFDDTTLVAKIKEEKSRITTLNNRINLLKEELDIKQNLLDKELISKTSFLSFKRSYNESIGERVQAFYRLEELRYKKANLTIKSPIYGYIHSIKNRSSGTIIKAGETVFEIVPYKREYIAELRIQAKDRGKVDVGKKTTLKFNSYSFTKYGGLVSELKSISATTFNDSLNRPYYKAYVDLPKNYIGSDENKLVILPGMTLLGEVSIGSKSLLEYLIVPLRVATDSAFNEP